MIMLDHVSNRLPVFAHSWHPRVNRKIRRTRRSVLFLSRSPEDAVGAFHCLRHDGLEGRVGLAHDGLADVVEAS